MICSPFPLTHWQRLAPPSVHHKWQAGSPTAASQQAQVQGAVLRRLPSPPQSEPKALIVGAPVQ